jgi:hypothetical protein
MIVDEYPIPEQADQALLWAEKQNPGHWVYHSKCVATACSRIAAQCGDMDSQKAYVLGLLHDIGRHGGSMRQRHLIEGYRFCMERGWPVAARICMTHDFPIKDITTGIGEGDMSDEDYSFLGDYLENVQYDSYDRLVQLCDNVTMHTGYCLLEVRLVDLARRYGINEYTLERWNAIYAIKEYFERQTGCSIYSFLDGIENNAFHGV